MTNQILFPNSSIIATQNFDVHQDQEIPIPGFFILAPFRKIKSIAEFTDAETTEFIVLLKKVRIKMQEILDIQEVYLFQNEDTDSGFHLWIFPRHAWMDQFGRKIQSVRPIINFAKEKMLTDADFKEVHRCVQLMKVALN
jgi:diadenosine tetraphosphate (Ap4A) HIT family hydrolase